VVGDAPVPELAAGRADPVATDWPVFPMSPALPEWRAMELKPHTLDRLLGGNAEDLLARAFAGLAPGRPRAVA
jgi:hypothetical protein